MARRAALGRGLGSLIPTEATGEGEGGLRQVPIGAIRPNSLQPRRHFDEASMASLAASIRELGLLQPVLVRQVAQDEYELIAGERRWRAARRVGLTSIPALVQAGAGDARSLEYALVENLHREDLNPLEEAAAYQQLIDEFSMTHEQVAKRVGRSRAAVTNTLRLLQLPAGVQRALADGSLSAGHARALLATPDRALQERLVARIVAEGLSVRAVEELVRSPQDRPHQVPEAPATPPAEVPARPGRAPAEPPEPWAAELEELLASFLDTRVKIEVGPRRGRIHVEFATLEDLERIYRLMVGEPPSTPEPAP